MRICVLAAGTRGDVQPAVALAAGLARRGAEVKLIAPAQFATLAAGRGFAFHPLPIDIAAEMQSPEAVEFFRNGGLRGFVRFSVDATRKFVAPTVPTVLEGGADAELVVATDLMDTWGGMLAQRLGVPCVHAWWAPMLPAADFLFAANEKAPPPMPGWARRAFYTAYEAALWLSLRPALREAYRQFGLPPPPLVAPLRSARARGDTLLLAYSEHLLPRSREWPGNVEVTGWWFLDDTAAWTPPPALQAFLAAGAPPVYIGFGSMSFLDPEATLAAVIGALRKTGVRAVIGAGWGGLKPEALPDTALLIDEAPHDWLFPRMAAIVHHGGAGTTGAALRAGKPSVVTPFIVDQFAWGRQLHAKGLAPAPLPNKNLTADTLAAAIAAALGDPAMRERAEAVGARVRAEDGIGRAADLVLAAARDAS